MSFRKINESLLCIIAPTKSISSFLVPTFCIAGRVFSKVHNHPRNKAVPQFSVAQLPQITSPCIF